MSFGNDLTVEQLNEAIRRYSQGVQLKKDSVPTCLHKSCPRCNGTGVSTSDGSYCIHGISCPCKDCRAWA